MHQLVRRQAKTQPGASSTLQYVWARVWQNMCVKKKESLNLSITHLLILSFQSLCFAPLCCPAPLLLSSSGSAAAVLKMISFSLNAWTLLIEFDPCSIVQCRVLKLSSLPCRLVPQSSLPHIWIFWVSAIKHCRLRIYSVQWKWGRGGVLVVGRIRRGWKGEMERIMEGSLRTRLLQGKLLNPGSGSFQDLLLHLKGQLWFD